MESHNTYLKVIQFLPSSLPKKDTEYIGKLIVNTHEQIQQTQQQIREKNELFL